MLLRSRCIYTEDGPLDGWLEISGGVILDYGPGARAGARDLGDFAVIPGIFDTHNHGTHGYTLWNYDKPEAEFRQDVLGFLRGCAANGVTSVFPTLFRASALDDTTLRGISVIAGLCGAENDGAAVAGVHFEGPYVNRVGEKGVRTEPAPIDLGFVRACIAAGGGHLLLMGHAPELPGSAALTRLLLENGVTAAFTHTDCTAAQAFAAFDEGVTVATHLCNVMVGVHHRDVGGLGACLLDDRVWCELICDGMHVCNDMLRLVLRAKSRARVMLISDGTGFAGAPTGRYRMEFEQTGQIIVDEQGFVREPNGRLSGSSKHVIYGIRNLVENCGIPAEDALRMASLNPARKYGFADRKGSIARGKDADLALVSPDWAVQETYVRGRKVFDAAEGKQLFNDAILARRMEG